MEFGFEIRFSLTKLGEDYSKNQFELRKINPELNLDDSKNIKKENFIQRKLNTNKRTKKLELVKVKKKIEKLHFIKNEIEKMEIFLYVDNREKRSKKGP